MEIQKSNDVNSMQTIWNRIEIQLQRLAPLARKSLRPGASEAALQQVEAFIPIMLPEEVKAVYRVHDGQADHTYFGECPGLVNGWSFLPLKRMCYLWLINSIEAGLFGSGCNPYFPSPILEQDPVLWHPHWLPFMQHWMGPGLCLYTGPL